MSLFDVIFKNRPKVNEKYYDGDFKMLNGYVPKFTTYGGSIYESQRIRSAINARATHISKLRVDMLGSARPSLQAKMKHAPNSFQTWSQFLYRLSTILDNFNTAFLCPIYDEYGEPSGIYSPIPQKCTITQYKGVPYLTYEFAHGTKASIEMEYCGIMTKFQYKSDFFGENNDALRQTLDLIHIQNQGIEEGVKSAATYRFMAIVSNFSKISDIKKERTAFSEENFSKDAKAGGLLLFPNTYKDIKQIDVKPWVVDAEQMKIINQSVDEYFGVNEKVLTAQCYGDEWTAYYESSIEPFALQFSEVCTKMLYTLREQTNGNRVVASANRLQYLSNNEKLNVSSQMLDRGIMSINDVREIWNLPPVEGGDARIIRGEYYNADEKVSDDSDNNGDDDAIE